MNLLIVQWAADECFRQKSGEKSVLWTCRAWVHLASQPRDSLSPELVILLGQIVDPEQYRNGYRNVPVSFANGTVNDAHNIPHQIETLCEYINVLSPLEWYTRFEEVRPFIDGNGRVGSLLFNFLSNTLRNPIAPPNIFGGDNEPV